MISYQIDLNLSHEYALMADEEEKTILSRLLKRDVVALHQDVTQACDKIKAEIIRLAKHPGEVEGQIVFNLSSEDHLATGALEEASLAGDSVKFIELDRSAKISANARNRAIRSVVSKALATSFASLLFLNLVGCGTESKGDKGSSNPDPTVSTSPTPTTTPTPSTTTTPTPSETTTPEARLPAPSFSGSVTLDSEEYNYDGTVTCTATALREKEYGITYTFEWEYQPYAEITHHYSPITDTCSAPGNVFITKVTSAEFLKGKKSFSVSDYPNLRGGFLSCKVTITNKQGTSKSELSDASYIKLASYPHYCP
jgi:hypothetical protein